ncbi:hypothetical protein [Jiella pacifica]|uniref:PNPLA domain-containing protein n=1 Tax=Jiella pacifica TaxID=2696469 RepID=A0A6N9T469_9HYPH|nr:hypothetical protein [Jiella pacifica]NDW04609.1 hypothetical protein [Jiella pacifica]
MSGGGIRSAAFNLGAIQALDACGIFEKIDYASMVSGGGYVGAGAIAAIKRHGMFPFVVADVRDANDHPIEDFQPVEAKRAAATMQQRTNSSMPGSAPVTSPATAEVADNLAVSRLRDRAQYLRPDGLWDFVVSAAIILRGLVVNVTMVAAAVLTLAGITLILNPTRYDLPRSVVFQIVEGLGWKTAHTDPPGVFETLFLTIVFGLCLLSAVLIWGLFRSLRPVPEARSDPGSWQARCAAAALILLIAICFAELVPEAVGLLLKLRDSKQGLGAIFDWAPQIITGLTAGTGLLALAWKRLATQLKSFSSDPRWSGLFKAAAARLTLVVLAMTLPAMIVVTYLWLVSIGVRPCTAEIRPCMQEYDYAPVWLAGMPIGVSLALAAAGITLAAAHVGHASRYGRAGKWGILGKDRMTPAERRLILGRIGAFMATGFLAALILAVLIPGFAETRPGSIGAFYLGTGFVAVALSLLFTGNATSLHRLYRDRLHYAFSMGPQVAKSTSEANAPFKLSELAAGHGIRPYPIINAAINIQKDKTNKRARNADFFIFTPNCSGSDSTGYVATQALEAEEPGLDLATAAAISGAAVSSSMGRAGVPLLSPSLALLNIRLGYWLRNPAVLASASALRKAKRRDWKLFYFLLEFFGRLNAEKSKVYLTDGGHIDNLGLYQLLKRRCPLIIVIDAEADPGMQFTSFVDVSRFARIDLGIRIDLPWEELREAALARKTELAGGARCATAERSRHVAFGRIRYPSRMIPDRQGQVENGFDGLLVYVKSMMTGDEKDYVLDYERRYPRFPHETTGDQFFAEEQFESYRYLGFHAVTEALCDQNGKPKGWQSLLALAERVRREAGFDPQGVGSVEPRHSRRPSRSPPQPARRRR